MEVSATKMLQSMDIDEMADLHTRCTHHDFNLHTRCTNHDFNLHTRRIHQGFDMS
jgi:hypothetical protein